MGQVLSAATARRINGNGGGGNGSRHGGSEGSRNKQDAPYRFPPKSGGPYFANHFIMGGEKFDSPQPESFLFGENSDLNFLGNQPVPFPYPPPQANEPTKTLRSLVNIRRDSLHFVLAPSPTNDGTTSKTTTPSLSKGTSEEGDEDDTAADEEYGTPEENTQEDVDSKETEDDEDDEDDIDETTNVRKKQNKRNPISDHQSRSKAIARRKKRYNIQFTFDADVRCAITIYYFCTEDITPQACTYSPAKPEICSETYYYNRGAGQIFSQPTHVFRPGVHQENSLQYSSSDMDAEYPVVIQLVALEHSSHGDAGCPRQSHATVATVEVTSDGNGYMLKPLKQKLFVDGLSYLLQEIYGLENKCVDEEDDGDDNNSFNGGYGKSSMSPYDDDDIDDSGADCVVCMCEIRDTIILPCRHLCLCYTCAESLRFQANNCPICRAPFRALLQLRAVQKISHAAHPALAGADPTPGLEGTPSGYMNVSLVEALNGPSAAALAAAAAATAAPSPLPLSMNIHASSSTSHHGGGGRRHRSKKPRSSNVVGAGNPSSSGGISSGGGSLAQLSTRITDLDNYIENDLSSRTELNSHDSNLRVNLPPEALPSTVIEMDETDRGANKQRKVKSDKYDKDRSEARGDAASKTKRKSKESISSPLAKSEDLVDEELANMDQAESLSIEVLSSNDKTKRRSQELCNSSKLSFVEDREGSIDIINNIEDIENVDSYSDRFRDEAQDDDDEAIIVSLPTTSSNRLSGKASPMLPGTPQSNTSSSARSSQDSSSASSTKQLLPKPSTTIISISASSGTTSVVSIPSTPVTIVPATAATILNVAPTESEEENC